MGKSELYPLEEIGIMAPNKKELIPQLLLGSGSGKKTKETYLEVPSPNCSAHDVHSSEEKGGKCEDLGEHSTNPKAWADTSPVLDDLQSSDLHSEV